MMNYLAVNSRLKTNFQMCLWNVRADDHVFSSSLLNFDNQSIQRGNCGGPVLNCPRYFPISCVFPISTDTFHAR